MIKNIIFDFGAVLIPIDDQKVWDAFKTLGGKPDLEDQKEVFHAYEKGEMSTHDFVRRLQPFFFRKKIFPNDLAEAWSALLYTPLPDESIKLLKKLGKHYRLFLLSNTNELHIREIRKTAGPFRYHQFTKQFEEIYFSHEVGMRKPDHEIFHKLIDDHELNAEETLFIDDREDNIQAASELGLRTWRFQASDRLSDIYQKLQ